MLRKFLVRFSKWLQSVKKGVIDLFLCIAIRVGHAYAKYAKYADYAHMRNMRMRIENLIHIFHIQREKTSLLILLSELKNMNL